MRGSSYLLDIPYVGRPPVPNHFNTHWLPTIFSLPDVRGSITGVVGGFIVQFQAGEYFRSTEKGVGHKSGPGVRIVTRAMVFWYGLTSRGVRH